jgi:hypothetical protein
VVVSKRKHSKRSIKTKPLEADVLDAARVLMGPPAKSVIERDQVADPSALRGQLVVADLALGGCPTWQPILAHDGVKLKQQRVAMCEVCVRTPESTRHTGCPFMLDPLAVMAACLPPEERHADPAND